MDIEKKLAMLDNFQLVKCLGSGYHAKVKLGINLDDGKVYAIKIFKKTHSFESNKQALTKEFQVMQGLSHPNLINIIEVKPNASYVKKNGQCYSCMAIVLQYAGAGELFEYVAQGGRFKEDVARTYFQQLIIALEYLHNKGIAHRDIKPENILFDDDFNLKVADFGFATAIEGKDGSGLLHTILGTESYMAPEINAKQPYQGAAVDIFATAIILFIVLTGHPPFMKADPKDAYYKLLCVNKHNVFWAAHSKGKPANFFSDDLKNMFNSMFAYDPTQRLSLAEVKSHPWFLGNTIHINELKKDFSQRRKLVDAEMEKQRMEKLAQKQQQQQNAIFSGVGTFRSLDADEMIKDLQQSYNLKLENKKYRTYDPKNFLFQENTTKIDGLLLFLNLLEKRQNFCTDLEIQQDDYSITCTRDPSLVKIKEEEIELPSSQLTSTQILKYQIDILKSQSGNEYAIELKKLSGSSLDYFTMVNNIKEIVRSIGEEMNQ